MNLLYTIKSINEIKEFKDKIKGIVLGNHDIALRLVTSFRLEEIKKAIREAHTYGLEVFIMMNKICSDEEITSIKRYIDELIFEDVYFICGDLGVYGLLKEKGIEQKCVFNPDTLICNFEDFNFFKHLNIYGAFLSLEIPTRDVSLISKQKKLKLFYKCFGYHHMFYSKRMLYKTYKDFTSTTINLHNKETTYLIEETRNEKYRFIEDDNGTNIYRPYIYSCLEDLENLGDVDYLFIDSIYLENSSFVIDAFAASIKNPSQSKELADGLKHTFDINVGFMYEDTVYKKGGE